MLANLVIEINKKLKNAFPSTHIYVSDITEGIKTPCFLVYIGDVNTERETSFLIRKNISVEIYYIPNDALDSKQEEIINTRNLLQDIFVDTDITLDNGVTFNFADISDQLVEEGVLSVNLFFGCILQIIDDEGDTMEDLELKGV